MIVLGTVGILWYLPVPPEFHDISPLLNWGSAFLMATAIYYFIISLSLAIGMLPFLLGLAACHSWLAQSPYPQLGVSIALLVSGTVGLWLGRRGKASLRGIVQDFQLMMISHVSAFQGSLLIRTNTSCRSGAVPLESVPLSPNPGISTVSKSALDPLDLFDVRSELSEEETMVQETVGRFVDDRVIPVISRAPDRRSG